MRLIKRYSNRKLYDMTTKTYVTLEAVGVMVSRGEEIQVRDNDTNEDLTSVILSQLLLEREREQRFLPSAVLSQLWRAGKEVGNLGQTIADLTRPFVPGSVRQFLEQEVEQSFKAWLDLAEGGEEELLRLLETLIERRRQGRHLNPPSKPAVEPNSRFPANPVGGVGATLARRLGLRRNLDDFEDWSQSEESTSIPIKTSQSVRTKDMTQERDAYFMDKAIQQAEKALTQGQAPFGAVVIGPDGELIGEGHNTTRADLDPSAHGEIVAIRKACAYIGTLSLKGATLYTSCEPCLLCSFVLTQMGITRVVFAARGSDVPTYQALFGADLTKAAEWVNAQPDWTPVEVVGDFMRERAIKSLQAYFGPKAEA